MERRGSLESAFGEVVRQLRTSARLSQEQLAEAADLHRNYVGLVERGVNSPSLSAVASIARALGVVPSELLRRAEEKASPPPATGESAKE